MEVNPGKRARLRKVINPDDGHSVVVAADHGGVSDPTFNVLELKSILKSVIQGRPDAVLLTPGQAVRLGYMLKGRDSPALIIRCDWMNYQRLGSTNVANCLPVQKLKRVATAKAKDALLLGASAITIYFFFGYDDDLEADNLQSCATFAQECEALGLPCIIEPIAVGGLVSGKNITELLKVSARIAVEIGADALKIPYTGDVKTFSELVKLAGVPVLMLGGAKSEKIKDALEIVEEALQAGAAGVVFGRNVTKAKDPEKMVRDIWAVVHQGKKISELFPLELRGKIKLKVEPTKCTGCHYCELICNYQHQGSYGLSFALLRSEVKGETYKPIVCTLCGKCIGACPQGALYFHKKYGYLQLNSKVCDGCKECLKACPLNLIKFDQKPIFCDFCAGDPQCVKWCPQGAIRIESWE